MNAILSTAQVHQQEITYQDLINKLCTDVHHAPANIAVIMLTAYVLKGFIIPKLCKKYRQEKKVLWCLDVLSGASDKAIIGGIAYYLVVAHYAGSITLPVYIGTVALLAAAAGIKIYTRGKTQWQKQSRKAE